jgi:hypothetical protein
MSGEEVAGVLQSSSGSRVSVQPPVQRALFVYMMLFGIASWITLYSTFAQLAWMVHLLPEGEALSSYVLVFMQIGTISPLLFCYLNPQFKRVSLVASVYALYALIFANCVLMALFWDAQVHGASVGLMATSLLAGSISGTTSGECVVTCGCVYARVSTIYMCIYCVYPLPHSRVLPLRRTATCGLYACLSSRGGPVWTISGAARSRTGVQRHQRGLCRAQSDHQHELPHSARVWGCVTRWIPHG